MDSVNFQPRDGVIATEKLEDPVIHPYVVPYDFDTSNITESDRREIIKRHYDFINWCENNTTSSYSIDNNYSPDGINVEFDSEEDCFNFMRYTSTIYWIFLHN